jgi:ATP-dependent DNA helicase RecG
LTVTVDNGSDDGVLWFFSLYPSHKKVLAVGNRNRARGEVKGGFMGLTMKQSTFKTAGGNLAEALTPVYPTVAGLCLAYLRGTVIAVRR